MRICPMSLHEMFLRGVILEMMDSAGEKVPIGCCESAIQIPHPSSVTVPPLPEGEGYFWDDGFCDSAFGCAKFYVNWGRAL